MHPSTRRLDRRPASASRQHATYTSVPRSVPPDHPGGKSGLRVLGLYGDPRRNLLRATPSPTLPGWCDLQRQRRPPFDPNLSEAARKTLGVAALPFGLTNVATSFQDALRGKFTDQVGGIHPLTDQIAD